MTVTVTALILGVKDCFRGQDALIALSKAEWRVECIYGVNARTFSVPEEWRDNQRSKRLVNRNLTDGEIACAYGHLQMLKEAARINADFTLFLEDDVHVSRLYELQNWLETCEVATPIFWACSEGNTGLSLKGNLESNRKKYSLSFIPVGAYGYIVNRLGIEALLHGYKYYGFQGYLADFPPFFTRYVKFKECPIDFVKTEHNPGKSLIGERVFNEHRTFSEIVFSLKKWTFINWLLGGHKDGSLSGYWMYNQGRTVRYLMIKIKAWFKSRWIFAPK